jgi:peptidyl-prolyl cis-trans isomerase SurA
MRLVMPSGNRAIAGLLAAFAFVLVQPLGASGATPESNKQAPGAPAAAAVPEAAQPKKPVKPHDENGIVALVNDLPITSYELRQRIALVMSTSNIPRTPEMEKKVRSQVLEQLETELLQRQEAAKNDITVSSVEVDKYVQGILEENRMTLEQLKGVLAHGGVAMSTFRSQIAAQLLWQKAVQEHYAGRVNITPEAISAEMTRIRDSANKAHFMVSEVFLPVDNPDLDDKVRKDAENIESQLRSGGNFAAIARQFSQSPSAAQGGDMGMVYDGQLAPELNKALLAMKTDDMSPPIRSIGGYYILVLRQRFEPLGTKIVETTPSAENLPPVLPLGRILLRLPPKPTKEYLDRVMQIANQIREAIPSCDMASKIPEKIPGSLYFPLGNTRLSDLNQQTRDALAKTESGGAAEPFKSDAGIEIFVRCDKAVPKQVAYQMPKREEIEQQLFSEQISALARRYNRDLRRSANIEVR